MTITVVGAGYVGLVTAAVFSDIGNKVYCVDNQKRKIEDLKKGKVPFFEPGLWEYLQRNYKAKRLHFTSDYAQAVPKSQVVFICVGTPPKNNGEADLSYLFSALQETAKNLATYTLIATKSTVPIGYEDDLESIVKKYAKTKYEFASCPEFLRESTAIEDTLHPDRIVVGATSPKAQKILLELHAPISGERIVTDMRSGQLIKYASNAFLATKVSFANAISTLCERTGADVEKVLLGIGQDTRIGHSFLKSGIGYGGSCLPKDVLALIAQAEHFGYNFELLKAVDSINKEQIENFVSKVKESLKISNKEGLSFDGYNLAVLGLAFKPNTDDVRDAQSIKIIQRLIAEGAHITAFDPQAMENAKKILPDIDFAENLYSTLVGKDAILILTEWQEFSTIDLQKAKELVKKPIIIDGRNAINPKKAIEAGFSYTGVGK